MFVRRLSKQKQTLLPVLHRVTTSLLLAALLAGLLPPSLVNNSVNAALPAAVAQPVIAASQALLPAPKAAQAADPAPVANQKVGIEAAPAAPLAKPLTAGLTGSNVLTITKTVVGTGSGPFNLTVTGPSGYVNSPTITPGTPVVLTGLASGVYTVTESSPGTGWTTVYTVTAGTGGSTNAVVTLQNSNSATLATTALSGKVFRDFNSDGLITAGTVNDTGVSGVTVTAYDKNSNSVGSATSASDGTYTINPTGAGPYRVEFTNLPSGYEPTTHGSANGTSTQFVTTVGGASNVNLGINAPCDYCQDTPKLVTVRQEAGDPTSNSDSAVVSMLYSASGATKQHTDDALLSTVGSIWGVAYQSSTKHAFVSAFLKRQSGFGQRGADGVYVVNYANATPALLGGFDLQGVIPTNGGAAIDVGSVTRNIVAGSISNDNDLSSDPTKPTRDLNAFGKVGKVSYGDIDIADDGKTLWLVNLNQRTLLAVDTTKLTISNSNPNPAPAAAVKQYNILAGGSAAVTITGAPTCTNGNLRPWALAFRNGKGYLGVVCDAASASTYQGPADLKAYVLSFNSTTPTSFTMEVTVNLDYAREMAWGPLASTGFNPLESPKWQRWMDAWTTGEIQTGEFTFIAAPQPILSDIVFLDDGSMALGFIDRFSHQQGWANYSAVAGSTSTFDAISVGDILRAKLSGGSYVLEGGDSDPASITNFDNTKNSSGLVTGAYLTNDGPSGAGEFFWGDYFFGSDALHGETSLGGEAILPGSNQVVNTVFDPLAFMSQGLRWLNTTTGDKAKSYQVVGSTNSIRLMGKDAGMGDVEMLCDPAPVEIGNRVWNDLNGNGLQDPGEPGLSSVTVSLQGPTNTITTNTDANGLYYFSVNRSTAYTLTVTPPSGYSLTAANANDVTSNTAITDTRDSDASLVGGKATIYYTTGSAGQNNHSLDFGFTQPVKVQVNISNTANGAIQVIKQVATTDGSSPTVSGSFTINVTCSGANFSSSSSQAVAAGGGVTFSNILAGATCTISEDTSKLPTAPSGYTWVNAQMSIANVTVVVGQTTAVIAKNTLASEPTATNVLTVTKAISGTGAGPFNITVTGPSGYISTTTINGGETKLFTGLLQGVYTVTEASPGAGWTTVYTATPGTRSGANAVVTLQNTNNATLATTAISGKVFRDFNSDGQITANGVITDSGVSGVTITAYDKNGNSVGSATSVANGTYTINPTGAGPYRVEFSNLPSGYEPTTHGPSASSGVNGTSTQFVTTIAGASNVNLGINYPHDYCQSNPLLCTNSLINGGLNTTAPTNALVSFRNDASGTTPTPTPLAAKSTVGATWGLAYGRSSGILYAAAFLKRHVAIGPSGPGAIYATNVKTGATSLFADLAALGANVGTIASNATRGLGAPAAPQNDATVFDQIGKVGLGGLALADNGGTLYVTSLNDKRLYALSVPNGSLSGSFALPDPGCVGGAWRPFATSFWRGDVYVGGVCDAQSSGLASNLRAYVYRFTPGANTFSQILNFPLNYAKGAAADSTCVNNTGWYAWISTLPTSCRNLSGANFYVWPQPLLSNIEFDTDGSMILGFIDRMAHQVGYDNYKLTGTGLERGTNGGDILRAYNNNGAYVLESNGHAGSITTAGAGNAQGPGGGEFYYGDKFSPYHYETTFGGLATLPGSGRVVATAMDPFTWDQGGIYWLSNTTGNAVQKYLIYSSNSGDPSTFGKSSGLGDLEYLCDAAPVEIGNRVWNDLNSNGIQDPGEPGLNGLTVSLQGPTNTVTTNTDADGLYYFNVNRSTAYTLTITPPSGYSVTTANAAALNGAGVSSNHAISDTRDSDAVLIGGKATIYYTTGSAGQNNHGIDFGFIRPATGTAGIINSAPVKIGNRLWIETDTDGDATTGTITPVVGQVVTATSSSGVVYTATTDSNGLYTITAPANAVYTVTTSIPAGALPSTLITSVANASNAAANDNKNHLYIGTVVTVVNSNNLSVDFGFHLPTAQFGDRVWIESDQDGLVSTGAITPVEGIVLTATSGTKIYTATTNSLGYYSFTVPIGSYRITYGAVPANYGAVHPSSIVGSGVLSGNAGGYQESGNPDTNQPQQTQVTVADGEANWQVDFAFTAPRADLSLTKTVDKTVAAHGDTLTYALVLTNHGPDAATNIAVSDVLPVAVNWVSDSGAGAYDHTTGLWTVNSLAANASVTLTITVQIK